MFEAIARRIAAADPLAAAEYAHRAGPRSTWVLRDVVTAVAPADPVTALAIIVSYDYELLNFNHDYTFYVIVYGCVFLLWFWWVKKFAGKRAAAAA